MQFRNISNAILTAVVAVLSNDIKFVISSFFIFVRSNKIFHYALSEKNYIGEAFSFLGFSKIFLYDFFYEIFFYK